MVVQSYKDLTVWKKAMSLVVEIYKVTDDFPKQEVFGLTSQMRRAAVAIPCHIAEGQGRGTKDGFRKALMAARGSLQEVETLTVLADRLGFLPGPGGQRLYDATSEVGRIIKAVREQLGEARQPRNTR
jgi:four helix bundle protein